MKSTFIYHHLGLGDHIICNGLVRSLLEKDSPQVAYLPVKNANVKTVTQMYCDDSRLICLPVESDEEAMHLMLKSGCNHLYRIGFEKTRCDWDVSFYDSVNLPFEYRWSRFKMCRDQNRERHIKEKLNLLEDEKFILIHNKASDRKYEITVNSPYRKIEVQPVTDSLIDWCGLIEQAEEVHCIDSSFIHLSQSLVIKKGFFHDVGRQPKHVRFVLRPSWCIISQSERKYDDRVLR